MRYFLIVISIYLFGCQEYTAHYPAGQPSERTLKSPYTGQWIFTSGVDLDSMKAFGYGGHTMRITPFNNQEFLIQLIGDSLKSIRDIDHFKGYISEIAGQKIANISPIDDPDSRPVYSVYKFELNGDSLKFWGIGENRFKSYNTLIDSEKDHKKFIAAKLAEKDAWNTAYLYIRKSNGR